MAKELKHLKINLTDKFEASGIIAKLSTSWRDFATTFKYKRIDIPVSDLMPLLMLRRKLKNRTNNLKPLRVRLVPTWCKVQIS